MPTLNTNRISIQDVGNKNTQTAPVDLFEARLERLIAQTITAARQERINPDSDYSVDPLLPSIMETEHDRDPLARENNNNIFNQTSFSTLAIVSPLPKISEEDSEKENEANNESDKEQRAHFMPFWAPIKERTEYTAASQIGNDNAFGQSLVKSPSQ